MEKGRGSLFYIMLIGFVCLFWGIGNPVIKIGLGSLDVFYALGLRYLIATAILFLIFKGRLVENLKNTNKKALVIVSLVTAAEFLTGNLAIMLSSATVAGFLMCISIIFTPFLSRLILKDKMDKRIFPVVILCVAGLYMLCSGNGGFSFGLGEIFALLCSLTTAVSLILSSKFLEKEEAVTLSAGQCMVTAIVSLVIAGIMGKIVTPGAINASGWYCVLYLAFICTVLAYMFQNAALGRISPVYASVTFCLEPIFTALAASILLKERLSAIGKWGAVLILFAILITTFLSVPKRAEKAI